MTSSMRVDVAETKRYYTATQQITVFNNAVKLDRVIQSVVQLHEGKLRHTIIGKASLKSNDKKSKELKLT